MQPLQIDDYRPPFITETDEIRWDDCTVCATLMAVSSATLGEVTSGPNWSTLTKTQLKARREKIRNWLPPEKQNGGTTMDDMRYAFGKEFPWLPPIPDYEAQKVTFSEMLNRLLAHGCAVLLGNPKDVKNVNSPLRRWTNNDDFGHAIYADDARKTATGYEIFIMDPLGRGSYKGQWVKASEVREFLWNYGANYVKAVMFKKGGWVKGSSVDAADLKSRLAELKNKYEAAESDLAAAEKRIDALEIKQARVKKAVVDLVVKIDNLSDLGKALENIT